ncbi:MAG: amidase family protein, partial [Aurantibacter sp.]
MDRRRFLKNTAAFSAALSVPLAFSNCRPTSNIPSDLTDLSAVDLSALIKKKRAGCVEVMQAYLNRIHQYNPVYNAIVSMVDDEALFHQARLADQALARGEYWGWMHGMPHAIKDLAPVAGLRHTDGSPMFADRIAEEDGALVAKIR